MSKKGEKYINNNLSKVGRKAILDDAIIVPASIIEED